MWQAEDITCMRRALDCAARGMYITTPNPRVGCVLARDGQLLGEGHTQPAGQDHAEIQALKDARRRGHSVAGATAYVTLEPCSHFGRTPPCANALIEAGIARVIVAMEDPNPLVAGRGLTMLRERGIDVRCGLLEAEARELNPGFISRMTRGRPWVRLKVAASLDGRTALHNGASQWITSGPARLDGHRWRARACALLTGIGTVREDDPLLTVRGVETPRQPLRVLIDSRFEVPDAARILEGGNTLVIVGNASDAVAAGRRQRLATSGVEVIALPGPNGKTELMEVMLELGRRGINELHVEAGFKLNGSLLQAGLVDELLVYLAPSVLGDAQGMFNLPALTSLDGRQAFHFHEVERVGDDLRIIARPLPQAAAPAQRVAKTFRPEADR